MAAAERSSIDAANALAAAAAAATTDVTATSIALSSGLGRRLRDSEVEADKISATVLEGGLRIGAELVTAHRDAGRAVSEMVHLAGLAERQRRDRVERTIEHFRVTMTTALDSAIKAVQELLLDPKLEVAGQLAADQEGVVNCLTAAASSAENGLKGQASSIAAGLDQEEERWRVAVSDAEVTIRKLSLDKRIADAPNTARAAAALAAKTGKAGMEAITGLVTDRVADWAAAVNAARTQAAEAVEAAAAAGTPTLNFKHSSRRVPLPQSWPEDWLIKHFNSVRAFIRPLAHIGQVATKRIDISTQSVLINYGGFDTLLALACSYNILPPL